MLDFLILLIVAFVPSLIYLVWIRNTERLGREPYTRLLRVFAFGAIVSVFIAIVLEVILMEFFYQNVDRVYELLGENPNIDTIVLACVIAPFVEELTKALGIFRARRFMQEVEDGMIYGAAAGLGFAATENLFYESDAFLTNGAEAAIATAVVRTLSSVLLHTSASAIVGLGLARSAKQARSWVPYYLAAVFMHGLFNLAASSGPIFEGDIGQSAYLIGLGAAFIIAMGGIRAVRSKIRLLERYG